MWGGIGRISRGQLRPYRTGLGPSATQFWTIILLCIHNKTENYQI